LAKEKKFRGVSESVKMTVWKKKIKPRTNASMEVVVA
jgi:hypothetical protein